MYLPLARSDCRGVGCFQLTDQTSHSRHVQLSVARCFAFGRQLEAQGWKHLSASCQLKPTTSPVLQRAMETFASGLELPKATSG